MSKENQQSFIQIYSNDTFDVYYDKDTKRYHIDVFNDGHYWDEVWFDAYEEGEYKFFQDFLNTEYSTEEIGKIVDKFNEIPNVYPIKYADIVKAMEASEDVIGDTMKRFYNNI